MTLHGDVGSGNASQAIELCHDDLEGVVGAGSGVDMRSYAFKKSGIRDGELGNRLGAELFHALGWMSDDLYYSTTGQFDKISPGPAATKPKPSPADAAVSGATAGGTAGTVTTGTGGE